LELLSLIPSYLEYTIYATLSVFEGMHHWCRIIGQGLTGIKQSLSKGDPDFTWNTGNRVVQSNRKIPSRFHQNALSSCTLKYRISYRYIKVFQFIWNYNNRLRFQRYYQKLSAASERPEMRHKIVQPHITLLILAFAIPPPAQHRSHSRLTPFPHFLCSYRHSHHSKIYPLMRFEVFSNGMRLSCWSYSHSHHRHMNASFPCNC